MSIRERLAVVIQALNNHAGTPEPGDRAALRMLIGFVTDIASVVLDLAMATHPPTREEYDKAQIREAAKRKPVAPPVYVSRSKEERAKPITDDRTAAIVHAYEFAPDPTTETLAAANRERAAIHKRLAVTQAALDKFQSADQAVQIMELRELMQGRERDAKMRETDAQIARLRLRIDNLQSQAAETEAMIKKWDAQIDAAIGAALHRDDETYADAAVRKIEELRAEIRRLSPHVCDPAPGQTLVDVAIEQLNTPCEDCKAMSAEIDRLTDIAHVADHDRVPLAMDNVELRRANERMRPVVEAAQRWAPIANDPNFGDGEASNLKNAGTGVFQYERPLLAAVEAFEKASADAANADVDDVCF